LDKKSLLVVSLAVSLASLALAPVLEAASLTPSRPGLLRQVRAANDHGFTYAYDVDDVQAMLRSGDLVRLPGNRDYAVKRTVSLPYARPETKLFVERLAGQYRDACGQQLVVTSLVRPKTRQPANSSPLSVHPTGMALDLRISDSRACRAWLERALLNLERRGVLEAARERRPPHYHVVLFPSQYVAYVRAKAGAEAVAGYRSPEPGATAVAAAVAAARTTTSEAPAAESSGGTYRVRSGDSLWTIARRFGTTTTALQRANGLASTRIEAGQTLALPGPGGGGEAPAVAAEYRVRSGDSLWEIARRHGTSVAAIQRANGLRGSSLRPGQTLVIPTGGGDAGPVIAQYRVRRGDNLWEIAQRHGTSPRQIQRANGLSSSRIKPGQVLTIPTAAR
jgi:LysM repeat protein